MARQLPLNEQIGAIKSKIYFAEKNNKPVVLKRLQKELEALTALPVQVVINPPVVKMADTTTNRAAFLFYNS